MAKVVTASLDRYPIYEVYSPHPVRRGGVIMRRLGGGAGRRRDRRTGPSIRQPAPGNSGPRTGAAPAGEPRKLTLGRRRGSARRYYGVLQGAGGRGRRSAAESAARRRKENAAAERRKARPARVMGWASPAIRRSARPRGGPRGWRIRTSASSRSASPIFL